MTVATRESEKLKIFISYSRDDIEFADQLDAALDGAGFSSTLDRHGIPGAEEWSRRLLELIREADTVVFVMTPSSNASTWCKWEVEQAIGYGKRIIPVVCRSLGATHAPQELSVLNYIYFYRDDKAAPDGGFGTGLGKLIRALSEDPAWLREHTRLLGLALQWDVAGRPTSRLLSGDDIAHAKTWLIERKKSKTEPTALHFEYIRASETEDVRRKDQTLKDIEERERLVEKAESEQLERQAAQRRELAAQRVKLRNTWIGATTAALLAILAGWFGFDATQKARQLSIEKAHVEVQKKEADAQKLIAQEEAEKVRAANNRLSAKMRLSMALLGERRVEVDENWYRLATTNAASIVLLYINSVDVPVATGFLVRAGDLYEGWGSDLVIVTADHVVSESSKSIVAVFPISAPSEKIELKTLLWRSADSMKNGSYQVDSVDVAVFRLQATPPQGAVPVRLGVKYDVTSWPSFSIGKTRGEAKPHGTLLSIGNFGMMVDGEEVGRPRGLTFAISLGVARTDKYGQPYKIVYSDSLGIGSSGTPVFDANNGELVAIEQWSADPPVLAGGILIQAVRAAIRQSLDISKVR